MKQTSRWKFCLTKAGVMVRRSILFLLALTLGIVCSSEIKCYQCKDCQEPFNATGLNTCQGASCYNSRTIQQNKYIGSSKGCLNTWDGLSSNCSTKIVNGDGFTYCTCNSNFCNRAQMAKVQYAFTILNFVFAYFMK